MSFFHSPYETLFAHKVAITALLFGLTLLGLAVDLLRRRDRDLRETLANLTIFAANNTVNLLVAQSLQLAALGLIGLLSPWRLPTNAYTFALCLLGIDFCYYWRHRWEHEVSLLWAEHSVHHSSEEFNFSTAIRLPVITPLFGWLFFTPLALLGFPAKLIAACYILDILYQYWVHFGAVGKLGWLELVLSTPSNHRVHHARNPRYLDKNYGGVLMIWDHLFGTYEPETERAEFGIVTPIGTRNPLLINVRPFQRLFAKLRAEPDLRGRLRAAFGRP